MTGTGSLGSKPDAVETLRSRVTSEWLPLFIASCQERLGHVHDPALLSIQTIVVPEAEAASFLRAVDGGVVKEIGGSFKLPRGRGRATLFEHGRKEPVPQPLRFYPEGMVAVAAAGDLHFDYGWPIEYLGFEAAHWEYDLLVETPEGQMLIAGEAKPSSKALDVLIQEITACASEPPHEKWECGRTNGHPKYQGLREYRPLFFWAVAPGDRRAFEVMRHDDAITLKRTADLPASQEFPQAR